MRELPGDNPVAAPLRERGCCQRVYRRYRHRYRKTHSQQPSTKLRRRINLRFRWTIINPGQLCTISAGLHFSLCLLLALETPTRHCQRSPRRRRPTAHGRLLPLAMHYRFWWSCDASSGLFSCGFTVERITIILLSKSNENGAPKESPNAATNRPRTVLSPRTGNAHRRRSSHAWDLLKR